MSKRRATCRGCGTVLDRRGHCLLTRITGEWCTFHDRAQAGALPLGMTIERPTAFTPGREVAP